MGSQLLATNVPRRTGRAWLTIGALLATVIVVVVAYDIVTSIAYRRLPPSVRTFRSPVRVLDVDIETGSAVVEAWSRIGASVTSTVTEGISSPSNAEDLTAGTLRISSSCRANYVGNDYCNLNVTIRVPATTKINVEAENGNITARGAVNSLNLDSGQGDVTVVGGRGRLELHSGQGEVNASDLTSSLVTATSSQGDVHIVFAAAPSDVLATSAQGNVTVLLPRGPDAYRVVARSDQGGVSTGSVHIDSTSRRVVTAISGQGDVSVRYGAP
jgi:hypothetical protein